MTPKIVSEFMVSLISKPKNSKILEPSTGEGIFIETLNNAGYNDVIGYEIDGSIVNKDQNIRIQSFIGADINEKYDVIIGNPPYIRWKNLEKELKSEAQESFIWAKHLNMLNDYSSLFIIKSVYHLNDHGELIFITPDYWFNTTHSQNMRDFLMQNGFIQDLYMFKETPIFKKVNVSLVIFKFIKTSIGASNNAPQINVHVYDSRKMITSDIFDRLREKNFNNSEIKNYTINQFSLGKKWIVASHDELDDLENYENSCMDIKNLFENHMNTFKDFCIISNGMVSGLDKAFALSKDKNQLTELEKNNLISVVKAKDIGQYVYKNISDYIFIEGIDNEEDLIRDFPNFYDELKEFKLQLGKRYSYNRDIPYWEWVFLRNYSTFNQNNNRIFVPCKERISNKDYLRFAIVESSIYPTQDVTSIIPNDQTKESIEYVCAMLNSEQVFNWIKHKGIIKGNIVEFSSAPIQSIPYRKIDFNNHKEKDLHDRITECVKKYIRTKDEFIRKQIQILFDELV